MDRLWGTDVWYLKSVLRSDLRLIYRFVVRDYLADVNRLDGVDFEVAHRLETKLTTRSFADPHNPSRLPPLQIEPDDELPPPANWVSVLSLRDAPAEDPRYKPRRRAGALTSHAFQSTILGNERTVTVHTSPSSMLERRCLLVMLDGEWWLRVGELPLALQSLQADGSIPPTVAVFVHNATPTSRMVEMPCEPRLPKMIAEELVPFVCASHSIAADPRQAVIAGASYGGLAAAWVAFMRPDLFGNVLSSSGSFWWGLARDGEPEWLTRQYALADCKPIRFWLDVGILERTPIPQAPGVDQVSSNRHLRTVLKAKGYDVTYYESPGGHDFSSWRRTVVTGLQTLLSMQDERRPPGATPALDSQDGT
jgi:enterochelin esterase-like enzyme